MKKLRVILSVIMALCLSIGIVACGKTKTATVTFDLGYEGATNFTQSVAVENSAVEPKDPAREGYEFGGWYTDGTFATAYEFAAKVDADKSVYAKWNKLNTVTYDLDDGEFDQYRQMSQTVATGSAFALHPAPQKDKAAFAGWKVGNQVYTPGSNVTLAADGDVTVEAVWTNQYTVTFVDYDGTEIDVQTINEGEAATAPEFAGTARPNYRFAEAWSVDFDEVDSDMTVTAVYAYVASEDMFFSYSALKEGYLPAEDGDELIGYAVAANADNKATIPDDLVLPREYNGMNVIGVVGFNGLTIKSVYIPNTIEVIGHQAFMSCTKLLDVVYEEGCQVEAIGDYAFGGANNNNLMNYTEIFIPASVKTIGDHAYGYVYKNKVTSLVFEEGSVLETVGDFAFGAETTGNGQNKIIDKIVIPASVKTIGERAFYNIARHIEIEEGSVLETIGDYAFASRAHTDANAVYMEQAEFVIPASVKQIGMAAFYYQGMQVIRFEEGTTITDIPAQFAASSSLAHIDIPATVTDIWAAAFQNTKLTSITIPATVKHIHDGYDTIKQYSATDGSPMYFGKGYGVFQQSYGIGEVVFEKATATDAALVIGAETFMGEQGTSSTSKYRIRGFHFADLKIPAHCVEIGDAAFAYAEIDKLTFTDGKYQQSSNKSKLAKIGDFAFAQVSPFDGSNPAFKEADDIFNSNKPYNLVVGNSQLQNVEIPASVTEMGVAIFAGNLSLTRAVLPEKATEVPSAMFAFCPQLPLAKSVPSSTSTGVMIPATVTRIGGYAFAGYQNGTTDTLKLGNNAGALVNTVNTTTTPSGWTIGANVTYIGPSAFAARSKFKPAITENTTEGATLEIGANAFSANVTGSSAPVTENTTLTSVVIPAQVKEIPANLFAGCTAISTYTLGSGIKEIPEGFLSGNTKITSYEIPAQITKIGKNAFKGSVVTSVTLAADNKLEVIGDSAFEGLTEVTSFPFADATKLKTIATKAFLGSGLTAVEIPASVEYIGVDAFKNVYGLTSLSFAATPAEGAVGLYIDDGAFSVATSQLNTTTYLYKATTESALTGTVQLPKRLAFINSKAFLGVGISAYTVEGNDVTKDSAYIARDGVLYYVIQRDGDTKEVKSDNLISVPRKSELTSITTGATTTAISDHAIYMVENLETFVGTNIKLFGEAYVYEEIDVTEGEGDTLVVVGKAHSMVVDDNGMTNVLFSNPKLTSATFPALTEIKTTSTSVLRNPLLESFEIPATATVTTAHSMIQYNVGMKTVIIRCDYQGTTALLGNTTNGLKNIETVIYLGNVTKNNKVIYNSAYSKLTNIYLKDKAAVTAAADNVSFKLQENATISVYQPVVVE